MIFAILLQNFRLSPATYSFIFFCIFSTFLHIIISQNSLDCLGNFRYLRFNHLSRDVDIENCKSVSPFYTQRKEDNRNYAKRYLVPNISINCFFFRSQFLTHFLACVDRRMIFYARRVTLCRSVSRRTSLTKGNRTARAVTREISSPSVASIPRFSQSAT